MKPLWYLSTDWGLALDTYNWKLLKAVHSKKTVSDVKWRTKAYFPTIKQLAIGLQERMLRENTGNETLEEHVKEVIDMHIACQKSLINFFEQYGVDLETPPRQAYKIIKPKEET